MRRSLRSGFALVLMVALASPRFARTTPSSSARQTAEPSLVGTWDGTYEPPGVVGGDPFSLRIAALEGDAVRGELVLPDALLAFEGVFDRARGALAFEVEVEKEVTAVELLVKGEELTGHARAGAAPSATSEWGFHARFVSSELLERSHAPRVVELAGRELPETFSLVGIDGEVGFALDELMRGTMAKAELVGVSLACVVDGELVDVRSLGWEDFFGDVPASDETRYRWASISKPLTATAVLRLAARGGIDLDADVRALVPEFPAKTVGDAAVRITPRHILCHQSGIVHYDGARRTWREYSNPHPFEELVRALDLFAESPLLAAPGTLYSYSTHAWSLLGLSLERAAKKPYPEVVRELVLAPLGMTSTEPDFRSRAIPHRTKGYERGADGRLVETFDDDVSWKLPGGGWTSTVGDLARFGAGLMGTALFDESLKREAWTAQRLPGGETTDVGLGFFLGELAGERLVSHSGGQRKASTFLAVLPERRLAVAAMSNTSTAPMEPLALAVLRLLLDPRR